MVHELRCPNRTRPLWSARELGPALALTQRDWHYTCLSQFAKSNGSNDNKKDDVALSSTDEDEGERKSASPSWRATLEQDSRTQQHSSPPLLEDRAPRGGLAGLVVKGRQKQQRRRCLRCHFPMLSIMPRLRRCERGSPSRTNDSGVAATHAKRRKTQKMMRTERYRCVYPGRSALRTTAVVWHVGQVLVTSVRSVLFVCSRICGSGCAAEMIMRPKTPHAFIFPPV